ncbi:MAG: efflux transporter outer membrane subunit [Gammaproteobacteria bacterium]|nr:efflux transporter outer membrane subunit [Gammaproteobacteria bacterium]
MQLARGQSPIKWAALGLALLLAGCAGHIRHLPEQAQVVIPDQWEIDKQEQESSPEQAVAAQVKAVNSGWLETFADDDLNKYVAAALARNPDLYASAAQLKGAIEQVTINGSLLWPNMRASVTDSDIENEVNGVTTDIRTVSGALDISWEADVWGKLTQRKKAAAYSAKAQGELFKAAELSLVANVSRAWYNLVTNKLQLDLAQQRLDSFQRTAALIEENYQRGLRSALDVYLSRTDVQLQISALSETEFSYIQSLRAFKSLMGEYPDTELAFKASLPSIRGTVPGGLPAELLTRRPDIKASQLFYQSTVANAKAARRDRFPSLNFNGSIGDSRDSFNQLFDNNNMVVSLLSSLTQPLFQAGALRSREDQAVYQAEEAYAQLVRTTLNAFEEVENSLSRESLLVDQHHAIKEAVNFAQGGLDLALDRYQSGIENYTTVLESQRRLFDSMRTELNIRNALLQNRIGIHLALGGDFVSSDNRDPTADLPDIIAD